jgi:FkbM family methyltransferase
MPQPRKRAKAKPLDKPANPRVGRFRTRALNDIPTRLPKLRPGTVFDVGAHVGETALELAEAFPEARVHCFEPSKAAYDLLGKAVKSEDRVVLTRAALGASKGKAWIKADDASPQNPISLERVDSGKQIQVLEGDAFCEENGIARIGYLKIRTVGHDLEVLRGFHRMLGQGSIDMIQVEAGIYSEARRPVPLERFRGYLGTLGYEIFGLYNGSRNFKGRPVLARVDAVFMSPEVLRANTIPQG